MAWGAETVTDQPETATALVQGLKPKTKLDVSTIMAIGVAAALGVALGVAVLTHDQELVRDLAKNYIGPAFLLIVGYYFGSSKSSASKDATIAGLANSQ